VGDGQRGPVDTKEANRFFEAACDGGHMEGCRNLGMSDANGIGVTKDPGLAKTLFQKACDGGFRRACSLAQ
jgi:TPR repeat protein